MKTQDRHFIAGVIVIVMVLLAWKVNAATAPSPTPHEPTVALRHTTVTMCGMLIMYLADQEGEWFTGHVGKELVTLGPMIKGFRDTGRLSANTELAEHYPPVWYSCERIHEAQVEWGREQGYPTEMLDEMERAFKAWRDGSGLPQKP